MSEETLKKVRESIDAFNRRDFDEDATFELPQFAAGATAPVLRRRTVCGPFRARHRGALRRVSH